MNKEQSNEPSSSKRSKKNGKGKTLCSYCGRGFHLEISCMRRQIDEMTLLLKKHNITTPVSTRNTDHTEDTEDTKDYFEIGHALKASCSTAHAFLIDSGASNHMVNPENHSLPCSILMVLVFKWEITVKFEPKGRVISSLSVESSKMCFICPP